MADTEKKRPDYKHKDGKCAVQCKFYENGYCKITGEYMKRTNMMGPIKAADCEPYIIDLRRSSKKDYPEYHDTLDLEVPPEDRPFDEDLVDELRSLAHENVEVLNRIDKKMSMLLKEVKLSGSGE
jgi:hypothetical protein